MKKVVVLFSILMLSGNPAMGLGLELDSIDPALKAHWCYPYLSILVDAGYIHGNADGDYMIEKQLSVAEFLAVMAQISGEAVGQNTTGSGSWYGPYVDWAVSNNIIRQDSFTNYNEPITRGQAAWVIQNTLNIQIEEQEMATVIHYIKDYPDMNPLYRESVAVCYNAGIMTGNNGFLREADTLKRSEAFVLFSTVIHREMRSEPDRSPVFYAVPVPDSVQREMLGKSYKEHSIVQMDDLRYLKITHIGFDGNGQVGELIVHRLVADEVLDIFKELYEKGYAIEKMVLPDVYGGLDEQSMQDNNSSAFNDRPISSSSRSYHQFGLAIDINPLYNPYYNANTGSIQPSTASAHLDRNKDHDAYVLKGDDCYNAFVSRGWQWGGDWRNPKDYQHFEKTDVLDINRQ